MSSPEALEHENIVLFSGTERSVPEIAMYEVTNSKLVLKDKIFFESTKYLNKEYIVSIQNIDMKNKFINRVLAVSTHRRVFLIHAACNKMKLAVELDFTLSGLGKLEFGVKTLYAHGDYAVFYTDNKDKKNCVLRFLGEKSQVKGNMVAF